MGTQGSLYIFSQQMGSEGLSISLASSQSRLERISREFSRDTCVSKQLRSFLPAFDPLTLVLNTPLGFLVIVEAQP
jgi:hypothetical protein